MYLLQKSFVLKFIMLFILNFFVFHAISQPPIRVPEYPTKEEDKKSKLPDLGDKNKEKAGRDRNIEFDKQLEKEYNDSIIKDYLKETNYRPDKTYGANIFQSAAIANLAELSTPPLDYPIGVGDHIVVSLWGGAEMQESYVVARDGAIFPASLGKITVQGLTFDNVRSIINARFRSVVPGGTNIAVSLGQPRSINVNVVGEVKEPGPVTVSAFSNAFNVIAKAGGVTEFGNLRSIQISRNGHIIDEIDVYKYLNTGDFGRQIYLQNNDYILVGFVEKKVQAKGEFKRPMYYQLKKEEGVKALLKYSGGMKADAFASGMRITGTDNEKRIQKNVNAYNILRSKTLDFPLEDGDVVFLEALRKDIVNKVEVKGEVTYPDFYELKEGDKLFDIINRAGGVTKNTFLQKAFIFRGGGDSLKLKIDRLEVDISDINKNSNSVNNIPLMPYDQVLLFSENEFGEKEYVEIFGEVRKEGRVKKYGAMTLEDLLYLSGGIKPTAEFGRVEVSSIINLDSAKQGSTSKTIVASYQINPNLELDSIASHILLKPFDQVFVRKSPTIGLQQNVQIKGLVNYPGFYPKLNKDERISSFIARAGGIADNANLAGVILYRKKTDFLREKNIEDTRIDSLNGIAKDTTIAKLPSSKAADSALAESIKFIEQPISIDLYQAINNPNSKYDIILQDRDVVFIPETNPFVAVNGQVQSPVKVVFDKAHTNLLFYVDKAGGFGVKPWKKRVYITYASGKSRRTKSFMFFNFYPKVEEGTLITVPPKPEGQNLVEIAKTTLVAVIPAVMTVLLIKLTK